MFEHKRPSCLRMALHADRIPEGGGLQSLLLKRSMRVVTVAAFHQAFIHLVMKRLGEVRLDVGMASVAKRGLRSLQKVSFFLEAVDGMAIQAADIGLTVSGTREVGVIALMAGQALLVDLIRCRLGKAKDLGGIAA